jgi:hypothetical protein
VHEKNTTLIDIKRSSEFLSHGRVQGKRELFVYLIIIIIDINNLLQSFNSVQKNAGDCPDRESSRVSSMTLENLLISATNREAK